MYGGVAAVDSISHGNRQREGVMVRRGYQEHNQTGRQYNLPLFLVPNQQKFHKKLKNKKQKKCGLSVVICMFSLAMQSS